VLSHEDDDVAGEVRSMRVDEGVDVLEDAAPVSVCDRSGDKVSVVLRTPDGERTVDGTDLLVATGRTPNTAGIGLEAAGVRLDAGGYLAVDERLETSAPNVWGIGECCSQNPQFTHASFDDFRIIRDNMASGNRTRLDRLVPHCMFTDPELAGVGLTEREAARRGVEVRVSRLELGAVLRTQTTGETLPYTRLRDAVLAHPTDCQADSVGRSVAGVIRCAL